MRRKDVIFIVRFHVKLVVDLVVPCQRSDAKMPALNLVMAENGTKLFLPLFIPSRNRHDTSRYPFLILQHVGLRRKSRVFCVGTRPTTCCSTGFSLGDREIADRLHPLIPRWWGVHLSVSDRAYALE
jgi:hypothetical protein